MEAPKPSGGRSNVIGVGLQERRLGPTVLHTYRTTLDIDDIVPNDRQPRLGAKEDEEHGIGLYHETYEKAGRNPFTGESTVAVRRRMRIDRTAVRARALQDGESPAWRGGRTMRQVAKEVVAPRCRAAPRTPQIKDSVAIARKVDRRSRPHMDK